MKQIHNIVLINHASQTNTAVLQVQNGVACKVQVKISSAQCFHQDSVLRIFSQMPSTTAGFATSQCKHAGLSHSDILLIIDLKSSIISLFFLNQIRHPYLPDIPSPPR